MSDYRFKLRTDAILKGGFLSELSADEMRILLALIARGGSVSKEELQEITGCTAARVASATMLFSEAGVAVPRDAVRVTEEFESPRLITESYEPGSAEIAKTVRDNDLAELIDDFTRLIGKGALKPFEAGKITSLVEEYELTAEYIALYMAHLHERGRLTSAAALHSGAVKLFNDGIRDVESLNRYIQTVESTSALTSEIKSALGIYRRLSPTEEGYIKKWTEELSYSVPVVSLAYDITVLNTGKVSFKYMDKLISDWHAAGCTDVAQCEERYNERSKELAEGAKPARRGEEKPKLKYGDFDPEEALKNAIKNSGFFDDDE